MGIPQPIRATIGIIQRLDKPWREPPEDTDRIHRLVPKAIKVTVEAVKRRRLAGMGKAPHVKSLENFLPYLVHHKTGLRWI
jgi:hypothetical protein